ncbi:MAG TPA: phenylalanine--tRNA ligase subunit beta, partial [Chloroflexota bacterium]
DPLRVAQVSDAVAATPESRNVRMPLHDLDRLVGIPIPAETAAETLSLLGFGVTLEDNEILVQVPYWRRVDIEQSADLVEEVARLVGFDTLPPTLPRNTMPPPLPALGRYWREVARERLLSGGANEITTHSLTSGPAMARLVLPSNGTGSDEDPTWQRLVPNPDGVRERGAAIAPVRVQNPATTDRQMLRLTLLPSVLDVLARNMKHTEERLAFFEIDRTFFWREGDLPYERETLAIALSGLRRPRSWKETRPGPYDFFDLKGMLEAILRALQVREWEAVTSNHQSLHPGRSAALRAGGRSVAFFGELHPEVAAAFEIEGWPVQVAEVDLDTLFELASNVRVFQPLPRFPGVYRDIAVVVDRAVPAAELLRIVRSEGGEVLESARIFDVYEGEQLPPDKKSIAVEMVFRSAERTLTQDEVSEVMSRIVEALQQEYAASLRD